MVRFEPESEEELVRITALLDQLNLKYTTVEGGYKNIDTWVIAIEADSRAPLEASAIGTHGSITFSHTTGLITSYDKPDGEPDAEGYDNIVRVDVVEWHNTYPGETLEGDTTDILDLGFWTDKGDYCHPDYEWRKTYEEGRVGELAPEGKNGDNES